MESRAHQETSLDNSASLGVAAFMKKQLEFQKSGASIPQVCKKHFNSPYDVQEDIQFLQYYFIFNLLCMLKSIGKVI